MMDSETSGFKTFPSTQNTHKVSVSQETVYLDVYRNSKISVEVWKKPLDYKSSWIQVVTEFNELRGFRVVNCRTVWDKWVCERGHVVVKPMLCRDRLVCPICAEKYADDRVRKVLSDWRLLESKRGAKLYLIHIVFTFPKELWDRILENPDLGYRAVYESLSGLDKEHPIWFLGGQIGGVSRLHLWSSRDVFRVYPHVHVVVPNRLLKRNGRLKWFVRMRPYFSNGNLRLRWKLALKKVFGYECKDDVDVFVRYVDVERDRGKAVHVLRYVFRQFVYDVFRKGLENDERLEDDDVRKFIHKLLEIESSKHLVRYFGFLASNGKAWIKCVRSLGGMDEALDDGLVHDEEVKCPICGGKIVNVDRVLWSDVSVSKT